MKSDSRYELSDLRRYFSRSCNVRQCFGQTSRRLSNSIWKFLADRLSAIWLLVWREGFDHDSILCSTSLMMPHLGFTGIPAACHSFSTSADIILAREYLLIVGCEACRCQYVWRIACLVGRCFGDNDCLAEPITVSYCWFILLFLLDNDET